MNSVPIGKAEWSPANGIASRVAVGLAVVAAAVIIRIPLEPTLRGGNTFILLEPAIAIAAWYGGRLSGTIATVTGVVVSVLLYLRGLQSANEAVSLALFASNGMLLTILSSGLRNAYQNAIRARVKAEDWASRSDRLQRLSVALNRPMSPQQLSKTSIDFSVRLLGASGGVMAVGRTSDEKLRIVAAVGYTGGFETGREIPRQSWGPLEEAIRTGESTIYHSRSERVERYPELAPRFRSEGDSIVLPLLYQDTATGAIYLNFDGPSGYGQEDREFLRSIGAQVGSAFERSMLIESTNRMATEGQARAAELNTVLEAIGDGVLVGDARGQVILANKAVERLIGNVPASLSDLPERVEDAPGQIGSLSRSLARSPVKSSRWLEIVRYPVKAEAVSSDVVLIRDVTGRVEADLQRDAFLGVLSHELRTPVTSILIAADLLRRRLSGVDGRENDLINDIDAESNRLRNIVEDLLVLTRSERGALDVDTEPVLIHRVVNDVVERARQDTLETEILVQCPETLPAASGEPTYVEQVIRNLLSNAIKYGRSRGHPIEVTLEVAGDTIETRVMDRGVGFAPGERDRLFSLFYRNPKAVRSAPGAGIGLYVCRLLVEAMNGTIWARPREGGGAEFGFALPVATESVRTRRGPGIVEPFLGKAGATRL